MSGPHVRREAPGQALAEFALVLPAFVLIVLGILQVAQLFSAQVALVNAARDEARAAVTARVVSDPAATVACGAVGPDMRSRLAGAIPGFADARLQGDVTYSAVAGPDGSPSFVELTIRASYALPLAIPLAGDILDRVDGAGGPAWAPAGAALVLGSTETMRVEGSVPGGSVTCAL